MKDLTELTTHCIRCGFCLEACPTFSETGDERQSPRGRIYLVRSAAEGKLAWSEDVKPHLDSCLGCRACEPACPSGVEYGAILEIARDRIDAMKPDPVKRAFLTVTTSPVILKANLLLGKLLPNKRVPRLLSQVLSGRSAEVDQPQAQSFPKWPDLDETQLPAVKGEVYLLLGCAMRVLFPRVHEATKRLLRRAGFTVKEAPQGCCGALHAHNGDLATAQKLANTLMKDLAGNLPIIVDSAGCGATMKEYGHLTESAEGVAFQARVFDIAEFLQNEGFCDLIAQQASFAKAVTYHDACHLAHGQKIKDAPRNLIQSIPNLQFSELYEADMCCGSAGIYNVMQPTMARQLIDRKWKHIEDTGAEFVVSGNPGCHAWIAQRASEAKNNAEKDVTVLHTAELLEMSFHR